MAYYEAKTQDNKCIFCEIAKGNLETAGLFWEDKNFMAFLSIDPNTEGFTCVIPKQHFSSDVLKMPDIELSEFIIASKNVSKMLENAFEDVGRVGLIMEGTGIDHAHIKLVPMHGTEFLKDGGWHQVLSDKEHWFEKYQGWISSAGGPKANTEKLKSLAERIKNISR